MKISISELRKIVNKAITENLKKNKSLLEAIKRKKLAEDSDRVRRHNDGYGDDLEEASDPVKADDKE